MKKFWIFAVILILFNITKVYASEMSFEVDGSYYASFNDALNAVSDGGTITMNSDINLSNTLKISVSKEVNINMNGYSISSDSVYGTITIQSGIINFYDTIGTSKIDNTAYSSAYSKIIYVYKKLASYDSVLKVNNVQMSSEYYGIYAGKNASVYLDNVTINAYYDILTKGHYYLQIDGGRYIASKSVIYESSNSQNNMILSGNFAYGDALIVGETGADFSPFIAGGIFSSNIESLVVPDNKVIYEYGMYYVVPSDYEENTVDEDSENNNDVLSTDEIIAQLEQSLRELEEDLLLKEQELSAKEEELFAKEQEISNLESTISELQANNDAIAEELSDVLLNLYTKEQELNNLLAEFNNLQLNNDVLSEELQDKEQEILIIKQELSDLLDLISKLQADNEAIQEQLVFKENELQANMVEIQELLNAISQLESNNDILVDNLSEKETLLNEREKTIDELLSVINDLEINNDSLYEELDVKDAIIIANKQQLLSITTQINNLQEVNRQLSELLAQKELDAQNINEALLKKEAELHMKEEELQLRAEQLAKKEQLLIDRQRELESRIESNDSEKKYYVIMDEKQPEDNKNYGIKVEYEYIDIDSNNFKKMGSNYNVSHVLNINCLLYDFDNNLIIKNLEKIDNSVRVTINLPEDFDYEKEHLIAKYHNGELSLIKATIDKKNGTLSFESSEFSLFAIVDQKIDVNNSVDYATKTLSSSSIEPANLLLPVTMIIYALINIRKLKKLNYN